MHDIMNAASNIDKFHFIKGKQRMMIRYREQTACIEAKEAGGDRVKQRNNGSDDGSRI